MNPLKQKGLARDGLGQAVGIKKALSGEEVFLFSFLSIFEYSLFSIDIQSFCLYIFYYFLF
jgi:hypothetical protein